MGKKGFPRTVTEGRVQAMQLKLFIKTSVLQKHEKPRYKAAAREACGKKHLGEEPEDREAREQGTKRRLEDKRARLKGPTVPGSFSYIPGMAVESASHLPPPSVSSSRLGPINPWLSCFRGLTQTLPFPTSPLSHFYPSIPENSKAEV